MAGPYPLHPQPFPTIFGEPDADHMRPPDWERDRQPPPMPGFYGPPDPFSPFSGFDPTAPPNPFDPRSGFGRGPRYVFVYYVTRHHHHHHNTHTHTQLQFGGKICGGVLVCCHIPSADRVCCCCCFVECTGVPGFCRALMGS